MMPMYKIGERPEYEAELSDLSPATLRYTKIDTGNVTLSALGIDRPLSLTISFRDTSWPIIQRGLWQGTSDVVDVVVS